MGFHGNGLFRSLVDQIHLLAQALFASARHAKRFQSIGLGRKGLVDVTLEFLLFINEATKFVLSHLHVAALITAGAFVVATRTDVYLTHAVMFLTGTAFFDYSVSEVVDGFSKLKTTLSTVALNMERRHYGKL
ncbi:hypothetical protein Q7P37_001655 [Cladosporium fusiforme]